MSEMKKRWLSLYVENNIGVLAKISGMFSGKAYNLESLTVGTTEDSTVSRMTICVMGTDSTIEQIKKQLNHSVEVIKVIDFTEADVESRELMFIKVRDVTASQRSEIFQLAQVFEAKVRDAGWNSIMLEITSTEKQNNEFIMLMKRFNNIEIVRGGIVSIERCSKV